MQDAPQPPARQADEMLAMENVLTIDTDTGPRLVGRPGFTLMGGQLGGVGARTGQRAYQFTKRDGTEYTVVFCGGRVYAYTWATNVFASDVTVTNLVAQPTALGTSPWVNFGATITANTTTAPDGTVTADTASAPTDVYNNRVYYPFVPGATSLNVSMFVKAGTSATTFLYLNDNTAATGRSVIIDWVAGVPTVTNTGAGTLGTTPVIGATSGPDAYGFYRISFSITGVSAVNNYRLEYYPSFAGSVGQTSIVWGVQVTTGTTLQPYEQPLPAVPAEILTATDLSGASITLDASAKVYCATFADQLVVSDGVNVPWAWDGTSHGGLTKLTNCPVLYGQPVVYYGKLFGIKNTARQTIVWSEEGTPNTGYEAGGYNNAWDLVQTRTEGLVALAATNEALYYARQNSLGAITGAVTTDFQTTGTREALSDSLGTRCPAAFLVVDNQVVFLDQYDVLQVARVGAGTREIAAGAHQTLKGMATSAAAHAAIVAVDDPERDLIHVRIPESGYSVPTLTVNIQRSSLRFASVDRGFRGETLDMVKDSTGAPALVHIGGSDSGTYGEGYAYHHGHIYGSVWSDGFADGDEAIAHVLETGAVGHDTLVDKSWLRGDLSVLLPTSLSSVSLTCTTPHESSTALTLATVTPVGDLLDTTFIIDTSVCAVESSERKVTWTMRKRGRWCRVRLRHAVVDEEWALSELALEAVPVSRRVGVE